MNPNPIGDLLQQIEEILLEAWTETGYGQVSVASKRTNGTKIDVKVQGSTHYHFVIRSEDIQRWREQQEGKES
jgi:hypothetical protein